MHPLPEGRQGHEGRLTTLLEGAIAHLERHRVQVNELNVFPVADGDTGDSMLATLEGGPQEAVRRAYAAVPEPIEGTMLTVAHDMAAAGDLEQALQAGRDSLRRGPSLLPALREAGVVDSGGYALTLMVAGALAASRGEEPPPEEPMAPPTLRPVPRHRWCTNLLVGDSVMIARDGDATRVHVHTDDPDAVIALFASLGVQAVSEVAPFDGGSVTVIAEPQAALVASLACDEVEVTPGAPPPWWWLIAAE